MQNAKCATEGNPCGSRLPFPYSLKTTRGPLTSWTWSATSTSTRSAILMNGIPLFMPNSLRSKAMLPLIWPLPVPFFGSAQEFVETRILSSFPQNDEFGLRDCHALSLEQQIAEILVTAASSKKGLDVAVDGFYHSEAYFGPAVVQDAV